LLAVVLDAYRAFASDHEVQVEGLRRSLAPALTAIDRRHDVRHAAKLSWLAAALDQLQLRAIDGVRMSAIAREVGIHPAHMSRRFHEVFGESMSEVRDRVRIEHASRALLEQTSTISAIAAAVGFCDHAHLTRTFRRATQMTPSEFRRVVGDTCLAEDVRLNLHRPGAFSLHVSSAAGIRLV
jgi:AraC family transcriptional regulator